MLFWYFGSSEPGLKQHPGRILFCGGAECELNTSEAIKCNKAASYYHPAHHSGVILVQRKDTLYVYYMLYCILSVASFVGVKGRDVWVAPHICIPEY